MVVKYTGTVTLGDIQGFSTVFLYNEIEAIFGHTTTTRVYPKVRSKTMIQPSKYQFFVKYI